MPQTEPLERLQELDGQVNVIEAFDKRDVDELGGQATEEYRIDRESRADWENMAREAMKAMLQDKKPKNYPFPNASNVRVPLLTTAALQFAARAYPAIVQSPKMVRTEIIGKDTNQEKQARGERVETHMSYQLLKEMKGWESDTDTLLHQIPAIGCAFRKVFYSHEEKRADAKLIPALDFVVNQATTCLETVPRASHRFDLYPHEIQSRIRSGTFGEFDFRSISTDSNDEGFRPRNDGNSDPLAPHSFIEQHRYHDLDGDGYAEPWIVTVHEGSEQVVRVAPNFDLKRGTLNKRGQIVYLPRYNYFVKYGFVPDPAGGFYDVGFGLLLRTLSEAIDTSLNQMIDAGHLQVAGGGFIGSGLSLKKTELRFSPGVFHVVNASGDDIRKAVVQMQHQGPSETLMNLLVMLIDFGKQITAVQDIMTGESPRAQPATTTLAQIEQGLKVFSAIYKRIFRALGEEYKLLYDLNARFPNQEKYLKILDWHPAGLTPQIQSDTPAMPGQMQPEGAIPPGADMAQQPGMAPMQGETSPEMMQSPQAPVPIMVEDYAYDDCDIVPVADAHMVTDMQQLAKAQILMELAGHPTIGPTLNHAEIGKRVLQASKIENLAEIMPPKQGPTPIEQLNLAGMEAEVEAKKSEAALKQAQAQKALSEAGMAGQEGDSGEMQAKMAIDAKKLELDALDKERKFALEVAKAENEALEADRQFELEQVKLQQEAQLAERQFAFDAQTKERELEANQQMAEREFEANREDATADRMLQATQMGNEAFEADRQSQREDERNKAADEQAEKARSDEKERFDKEGRLKLNIEKLKAKNKPQAKK